MPRKPLGPDDRSFSRQTTVTKKIVSPDDRAVARRTTPEPLKALPPPVPILQTHGFQGSMNDFVQRLTSATQAHLDTFGYKPSPGFAFDLARAPVAPEQYHDLLAAPVPGKAPLGPDDRAFSLAQPQVPGPPTGSTQPGELPANVRRQKQSNVQDEYDAGLLNEYIQAEKNGKGGEYLVANGPEIADILGRKPQLAAALAREQYIAYSGFVASKPDTFATKAAGIVLEGGLQLVGGLILGPPTLAYEEGKGVKKSVEQRSLRPIGATQKNLAVGLAKGIYGDVTHPGANAGFLALDLLGVGALGAGGVVRVGTAFKAEGARATTKALVKKPLGGTVEIRRGNQVEHELLSENQLVNAAQRLLAKHRNAKLDERMKGEYPGGLVSVLKPQVAQDVIETVLDDVFRKPLSSEKKLGRLSMARRRVEKAIEDAPRRELEFTARATPLQMRLNRYLPGPLRRGLTVGEQKALQVHFSDLAGDDTAKLKAWQDFHESAIAQAPLLAKILGFDDAYIPQFIQEHGAQLAALKLAEKTLSSDKRSPRYLKAEALTRELEATATNQKILEFGLSPVTAEHRIAAAGEVVRTGAKVEPGTVERVSPDAIYTQFKSRTKGRKQTKLEARLLQGPRAGQYGIPAPDTRRYLPELHTEFHGNSILMGDFRVDTTNLASEAIGAVFRAGAVLREHGQLLKGATDRPTGSGFDMPIRTVKGNVPPQLKKILAHVDEGQISAEESAWLASQEQTDLIKHLFPGQKDPESGKWRLSPDEQIGGVKWVDSRSVLGVDTLPKLPDTVGKRAFQIINEPFRDAWLFARLAYGLNIPGNAGMLLMQQGPWLPNNLARGMFSRKIYGDRVTHALDALVGSGRMRSFINKDVESALLKPGKSLAEVWHRVADGWMRRSALIHEIQRQGFKGKEGFEEFLFNKEHQPQVVEASRRANKAAVEFDNLTEFEKNTLRNAIFVYPWQSRSFVWSLRTLVEHPAQSAILAELGHKESQDLQDQIKGHVADPLQEAVSKWFKRTGFFPIGWNADNTPKVINPTSINTFSTLKQMVDVGESLFVGDVPYSSLSDVLGPGGQFLTFLVTGKDSFGNALPGPDFVAAFGELLKTLPQYRAWQKGSKQATQPGLSPLDVTDRKTMEKRQLSAMKRMVLSPGWLNGWGSLISGGLTPRNLDTDAVFARYWRTLSATDRHKLERQFVDQGLKVQSDFLQKPVSPEVRDAVKTADAWTWRDRQIQTATGRSSLSSRERDGTLIDTLVEQGKLDKAAASKLRKQADGLVEDKEHKHFQDALLYRYAGKGDLQQWDADIRQVYAFKKDVLQHRLDVLARIGVAPKTTITSSQEALYKLGRKYLEFTKEAGRRQKLVDLTEGPAKTAAEAELRQWQDEQDKPLGNLPSPIRLAWAAQTQKARDDHLLSVTKRTWQTLSAFDKELLGKKASYSAAWTSYYASISEYKRAAPIGERTLKLDQRMALAKAVNKSFPGFIRDWDFASKRLFQRMKELKPIRESKNVSQWRGLIFDKAEALRQAVDNKVVTESDARAYWGDYMKQLRPWIAQSNHAFDQELRRYDKGKTAFLTSLFSRGTP